MRCFALFLLIAFPANICSQTAKAEQWNTVDKVCGVVVQRQVTNMPGFYYSARKPLGAGVMVALYHREERKKCCKTDHLVAQGQTGEGGRFEFVDVPAGEYWLAVSVGRKTHKLSIRLRVATDGSASQCLDFAYELGDENLLLKRLYQFE